MTRETKIGLLVGLAFIIVIGILLSDHLTNSTQPQPAPLAGAGANVLQSILTPGSNNAQASLPVTPGNITPGQTVLTQSDLNAPRNEQQPIQVVSVGPTPSPVLDIRTPSPDNTDSRTPIITGQLTDVSKLNNEMVPVPTSHSDSISPPTPAPTQKEYKAQSGDTVSKMAVKFFGKNTQANRDAIIKANASLRNSPHSVVVGRTYMIPVIATAETNSPTATPSPTPTDKVSAPAPAGERWYTVKEKDNLWKIAKDQCGSSSAITAIKELNRDVLKGTENLHIGMKLRLPAKAGSAAH